MLRKSTCLDLHITSVHVRTCVVDDGGGENRSRVCRPLINEPTELLFQMHCGIYICVCACVCVSG